MDLVLKAVSLSSSQAPNIPSSFVFSYRQTIAKLLSIRSPPPPPSSGLRLSSHQQSCCRRERTTPRRWAQISGRPSPSSPRFFGERHHVEFPIAAIQRRDIYQTRTLRPLMLTGHSDIFDVSHILLYATKTEESRQCRPYSACRVA